MSEKDQEKQGLERFFLDDAIPSFTGEAVVNTSYRQPSPAVRGLPLPVRPAGQKAGEEDMAAFWKDLRRFFRSEPAIRNQAEASPYRPAALYPFFPESELQTGFPLWLPHGTANGAPAALEDFLRNSLQATLPGQEQAKEVRDNLPRLAQLIREKVRFANGAYLAYPVLIEALDEMERQLDLQGSEGKQFSEDLKRWKASLPREGWLLPLSPLVSFFLLGLSLDTLQRERSAAVREEIQRLLGALDKLLAVEAAKNQNNPLGEVTQFAGDLLDFDRLPGLMPASGSQSLAPDRLDRLQTIRNVLQEADAQWFSHPAFILLDPQLAERIDTDTAELFPGAVVQVAATGSLSAQLTRLFDQVMTEARNLFAALRKARLELDNQYRPEVHDEFFAFFDWRAFSDEELAACPPVILLAEEDGFLSGEMAEVASLLSSNRLVNLFLYKKRLSGSEQWTQRLEPAAFFPSFRKLFYAQGSGLEGPDWLAQLARGISNPISSVFQLYFPEITRHWYALQTGAVAGRQLPEFSYEYLEGNPWSSRFRLGNNPDPEKDWPTIELDTTDETNAIRKEPIAVTFADLAALEGPYDAFFRPVPPEYWNDDLIPFHEYVKNEQEKNIGKVPYIQEVDADHRLQRLAVNWQLVLAARDRLDLWHYIQENTGIHNYHADRAAEKARIDTEARAARELEALRETHRLALEETREEAARQALAKVADFLLNLNDADIPALQATAPPEVVAPPLSDQQEPEAAARQQEPETTAVEPEKPAATAALGEPWIESDMCTSCNECIQINGKIFKYNDQQQAYIANPRGGSFEDIVMAAESCPAGIIHPGAPQDPDEKNLKELIERAKKFQ